MAPIVSDIKKILAQTEIKDHPDDYSIVFIDPAQRDAAWNAVKGLNPFTSYTITSDEVSLIIHSKDWAKLKNSFPGHREEGPYRLITFDIVLDLSIVGFLSVMLTALAEADVSVFAVSTFLKDHILVKKSDSEKAVTVLRGLITEARAG